MDIKDELDICQLYISGNKGCGIENLALKYKIGKLKVKDILIKHGIDFKTKGGQINNKKIYNFEELSNRFVNDDINFEYVAKSKHDGTIYKDYLNISGILTSFIKNVLLIDIPSQFKRKTWAEEKGMYWYEQYFDIVKIPVDKIENKKCKFCDWETVDIENKSGMYKTHLLNEHNINIEQYLSDYPEEEQYFSVDSKKINFINNKNEWVKCEICGKKLKRIDEKHLKRHHISLYDYKIKYDKLTVSNNLHNRLSDIAKIANLTTPKDKKYTSNIENDIIIFLEKNGITPIKNRSILCGGEIDILIEDKKIGIEFNGVKWHTEWFGKKDRNYHINKTIQCNEKGYGLIHIFEDEYMLHKEIVLNKLSHILGIQQDLPRIAGRKCTIKEINKNDADTFLNMYHIQGSSRSTVYLGSYFNDKLIAVMSFKKILNDTDDYDLTRFASDYNYVCQGVGGKLFKYFIKNYNPSSIISFADRRWTVDINNNVYTKLGFTLVDKLKPDYRYYNNNVDRYQRFHKFGFRKQIINRKYGLPLTMTETEMVKKLGYDRIWDCGLIKYKYEINGN